MQRIMKRKVYVCCLQKARRKDQGALFTTVKKDTNYGGQKQIAELVVTECWS